MNNRKLAIAGIATALLLAEGLWVYAFLPRPAEATRNSSGTYSLPTGNPVVSGTAVNSTTHNNTMSDIASELTDSLSRSGKGGMSAALKGTDGTVAAPAYSFTSEAGTGLYRIGSTDVGFSVNGTKKLELTSSLFTVTPAASFSSTLGVTGATTLSSTLAVSGLITQTVSGSASTITQSWLEASLSNGNSLSAIWGAAASNNASGALVFTPNATAANSTWCMAVFGQASTLCTDGNGTTSITKPTIATGVGADGSGFKHKRGVGGCTTAALAGATCNVTVTWTTAFADANYTATCNVNGSSGPVAYVGISSKVAASIAVAITAVTAVAATATTFECIAVHD